MKTATQREQEFRAALEELLMAHGAELNVTDDGRPYGMHSGVCEVSMQRQWDEQGHEIAEYTELRLLG